VAVNNVIRLSDILPSASERPRRAHQTQRNLIDLEFSDYGRDPRFLQGWWILPGLLVGAGLAAWAAGNAISWFSQF